MFDVIRRSPRAAWLVAFAVALSVVSSVPVTGRAALAEPLELVPALRQFKRGGVYLGVAPDQNFTYIVALEPKIAFIVDIRRGNLHAQLMSTPRVRSSGREQRARSDPAAAQGRRGWPHPDVSGRDDPGRHSVELDRGP